MIVYKPRQQINSQQMFINTYSSYFENKVEFTTNSLKKKYSSLRKYPCAKLYNGKPFEAKN